MGEGSGQATLIYHWDGSTWTRVPSPDPDGSFNYLYGVTAISTNDAWAVGVTETTDGHSASLTMHWDGSNWTVVSSPDPTGDAGLQEVSAASTNDVWAVGTKSTCTGGGHCETLAMHWDGSSWTVIPTPYSPSGYLNGAARCGRHQRRWQRHLGGGNDRLRIHLVHSLGRKPLALAR